MNTMNTNVIQLMSESELLEEEKEAFASILINPAVTWAKFILTDDKPNKNKQRIPLEEFDNIIRTGIFMPIKMAYGSIKEGHEDSFPIGVITHLKKVENQIKAIAALWSKERPEDIDLLKSNMKKKVPINMSWEILYEDAKKDGNGISDLLNTTLQGVNIVGRPAYAGRTPMLALAAKGSKAYIDELPKEHFLLEDEKKFPYMNKDKKLDAELIRESISAISVDESIKDKKPLTKRANKLLSQALAEEQDNINMEDTKLDELEKLQKEVSELKASLSGKDSILAQTEKKVAELEGSAKAAEDELKSLREYKESIEEEEASKKKLSEIKDKFVKAGLERPVNYFEENKKEFLSFDEGSLDFMIQNLISFSKKEGRASEDKRNLPPLNQDSIEELSIEELAKELKDRKLKK